MSLFYVTLIDSIYRVLLVCECFYSAFAFLWIIILWFLILKNVVDCPLAPP